MKQGQRSSIIGKIFRVRTGEVAQGAAVSAEQLPLSGDSLEQAYRELLLENQVLAESNLRLHERLARRENGLEESPAARELIRAQRNALAERSHKLREVEYENQQLKRQQKKLFEENRRLSASLAKHMEDIQPLLRADAVKQRELDQARQQLREKSSELLKLTDKYYQLQARSKPQPPPSSAANGDF
ncbi:MAG: hypothetical protein KDI82_14835 [Gammaproteobacteria bacterium]|nr:hypothetical protein [Gammaproteobacteria bacterium]